MLDIKNMECKYDKILFSKLKILNINPGLTFIIGRSGCGKTSLIKSIIGLNKYSKGEIYLNGKRIRDFQKFRENYVSIGFQDDRLLPYYTIKENLLMVSQNNKEIDRLLNKFHIHNKKDCYPDTLSGGQRQRVNIIRACLKQTYINIFDEPTSSVNDTLKEDIMDFIKYNFKDKIVIIVSHNMNLVNQFADRIIDLENGDDIIIRRNKDSELISREFNPPLFNLTLRSYKKRSIFPILVISFVYIIFFSTFSLFDGIDRFVEYNLEKKIDYKYFYVFTHNKSEINEIRNLLVNVDYKELKDFRSLINQKYIHKILFNDQLLRDYYEIHIYDGDEKILINTHLYNLVETTKVKFLDKYYDVKVIEDGNIYTSPNIYFDYNFLDEILNVETNINYVFKATDYHKTYDLMKSNFNNLYSLNDDKKMKFDNSTILVNESLKELLKSIHSLILLLSYSVIFMSITFIKTLIDYNTKLRTKEMEIYEYLGLKNKYKIYLIESIILTVLPLVVSIIFFMNLTPLLNKISLYLLGEYFPIFSFNLKLLYYSLILVFIINIIIYYGNRFNKYKQKISAPKGS